jgi:flagellar biosynthesis protein FlhF
MMEVLYAESPGAGLPSEFAPHYRALIERGVSRKVAAVLIGAVVKNCDLAIMRDKRVFAERLHTEIRKIVHGTGGLAVQAGECRVVAVCGATGVGKTTNLAKLAAYFSVRERARVALITSDTYRVAAAEQLRVYANIIGIPMKIAHAESDMEEALREYAGYDLVLIDTAGGSQFNLEQINELKGGLRAARPHETILVMSACTPLADMRNIVANFNCCNPTSVLFTKLDETRQYGAMLSVLAESGLPMSYLSTGQNVPDDICLASPAIMANLILEGRIKRG